MAEFQDVLNQLAGELVREFNQLHTTGYDLDGNPGQEFFTPIDPSATQDMAREIQVNIRDGDQIAAAQDPDALPGDNRNALAIAGLRDALVVDGGKTTFGGFYQSLVGRVGADVQDAARKAEAGEAVYESMMDYKNSVSGVSLEEEEIRLLAYQHAYQAAAKFLTVVEDLMDTLLAI
jgi:flagellar hook-associated protein 1 FlgK